MATFVPVSRDVGFDPAGGSSPNPWQASFKNESAAVKLLNGPKHKITVEPSGQIIAFVIEQPPAPDGSRFLRIKTDDVGQVTVVAKDPARAGSETRLDIEVMETTTRKVRFYRIIDGANHQAKRTLASMRQVLIDASTIHSLQNGVFLNFQGAQDLIISDDFGKIVVSKTALDALEKLFTSGGLDRCQADFHVFLVWSVETDPDDAHSGRQKTLAVTRGDMCLFEDFAQAPGPVLAHEAGHYMLSNDVGGDGHVHVVDNLMFPLANNGKHLNRTQILIMNRNARTGALMPEACQAPVPPTLDR